MCAHFIIRYWTLILFLSLGRAFGVLRCLKWCLSFYGQLLGVHGILTIDNLVKRNLPIVNWCCLCRCNEETVDHLLLHCKFARALWSEIFLVFVVQWVMLNTIVSLLFARRNWLGTFSSNIWNMVPACLTWLIWEERSSQTFEDIERLVDLLKSLLAKTLFKWSRIWGFTHSISMFGFLISVSSSL